MFVDFVIAKFTTCMEFAMYVSFVFPMKVSANHWLAGMGGLHTDADTGAPENEGEWSVNSVNFSHFVNSVIS